jgi:CPA2 family monovalent cation:H+ antiporter-2
MHDLDLITTLAGGLAAALVFGYVTQRLGLSPIVGYLLAGIAVGPATPGFVANRATAEQLAELGIILLMFGVGLQFHFHELLAVRRIAVPGAVLQSLVATALGATVIAWVGWGWTAGVVYGLAVSVASTVVLVRVLSDSDDLHTSTGHIAVGWLVMEDLFTVLILVLLPLVFESGASTPGGVALGLLMPILKIGALVALMFLVGDRVIPWLLAQVAATRSRELFTLTILVVALGIAVGSAEVFGVSMALGAFLAGMVVGRSDFSLRAASEALPMRDAFAVLFFVSVGMLFDPVSLLKSPAIVLLTLAVIMIGKPLAAFGITAMLGYPSRVALAIAAVLGQIGEFSFMLAVLGRQLGILPDDATNALVAAAIVSISVNPLVYRTVEPVEQWLARRPSVWGRLNHWARSPFAGAPLEFEGPEMDPRYRAVIVGHGHVGRTVARLLREEGIESSIIEMNLSTTQQLREAGAKVFYGDATLRPTLEQAGVGAAGTFVLSVSGFRGAEEVIRLAREINPGIHIIARTRYLADIPALRRAGADRVFSGEGEVALAMTEYVLSLLGATPEQIDRERARVHEELF